jgi:DNA primase
VYVKDCSNILEIKEAALLKEINKIRREKYDKSKTSATPDTEKPAAETTETPQQETTVVPTESTTRTIQPKDNLEKNILNIIQVLIKYGNFSIYDTTVGQYILEEIQNNGITFENPLYEKILQEYALHKDDEGFVSETFFKFHTNSYISSLAIELISDKYELSKIFGKQNISENVRVEEKIPTDADRLEQLVPQLIYELQLTIVKEKLIFVKYALKHAQENHKEDEMIDLLKQSMQLKELEKQLCKLLGNRIGG